MGHQYDDFKEKAYSALRQLAKESPNFADAQMLVGSADTSAHLARQFVRKSIDTEWVERIEAALPALDLIVRNPTVMIADEEEIVPVELTKRISEKSIKHLAQHTNLILSIEGDEVTPSKLLNVFHEETLHTYENRFINTLLIRLSAFVDKRYRALIGGSGIEQNFKFDYQTEFEHYAEADDRRNSARINLRIELTSPLAAETSEADKELNAKYAEVLARVKRISQALNTYMASPFVQRMGKAYIRPPVIRTNAILKNKNFKECLLLWEFIESFDKVGYSFVGDEFAEKPADEYVTDLYTSVALQYTQFYNGIVQEGEDVKMLAQKRLFETFPDFAPEVNEEELEDYLVYDSEYRKTVPVSRLMNNKKKLSEDELRIREAIIIALKADDILTEEIRRAEEEARRLERERREREEEEARRAAAAAAAKERGPIEIRYKRSYLSRLIQASDELQGYYNTIKNELLSYKKVVGRTSWKCETFKRGRQYLSRINVKGKTLYVYLALDPAEYENKHFVSNAADKMPETPVLVKVKSEKSMNQALKLIAAMAEQQGLTRIEREAEDFRMPYEDDNALIEKGLIKIVLPSGVTLDELDETVKADILRFIGEPKPKAEQEVAAEADTDAEPEQQPTVALAQAPFDGVRLRRSFLSRYIQADAELQDYYTAIKNRLLSFKKVVDRTSWKCETFKRGRQYLSRINVMGKTLYVYLALDPAVYGDRMFASDATAKMPETPVLIKVKSERSMNQALEMIEEMAEQLDLVRIDREAEDFHMPYEDDNALIEKGLIKVMTPDGMDAADAKASIANLIAQKAESTQTGEEIAPEPAPEPTQAAVAIAGAPFDGVRYRRSFLSRYIQADAELQDYYTAIKNKLLSFKKVVDRTSWKCETFKRGRQYLSRINVMGKTLYVYLALDAATYADRMFASDATAKMPETPVLIKVKSERSMNQALEMIEEMAEQLDLVRIDREAEDFHMPYEDDDALIEKGLIKVMAPDGTDATAERANIGDLIAQKAESADTGAEIALEEPAEQEAEQPEVPELQLDEQLAALEQRIVLDDAPFDGVRYRRSFLSRYIQADAELQDYYTAIKNELLSYKKVVDRTSWKCETFKRGRQYLSRINVMGKTLYVYLALDAATYSERMYASDATAKMPETPVLVKVKNERSMNQTIQMIAEMMAQLGLARIEREAEDFHMPYEDDDALIAKGLIKVSAPSDMNMDEATKLDLTKYINQEREALHPGMVITPELAAANVIADYEPTPATEEAAEPVAEPVAEPEAPAAEIAEATEADATAGTSLFDGVRYRRSFLSRYIQAEPELQEYYTTIKNKLLSFKKVVARTSWKCETFKSGRQYLARINVMGKNLYVYLALDAATYGDRMFTSNAGAKMPETPVLVKVKSERSMNQALLLIEELAEQLDLLRIDHEAEDFRMPYEDDNALIEKGLIKIMTPDGSTEEATKANVGGLIAEKRTEMRPNTPVSLDIAPDQAARNVVFKDRFAAGDDSGSPFAYSPQFIIGREPVAPDAEPTQTPLGAGSSTFAYGGTGGDAPSRSMPFIDEDARALEEAAKAAAEEESATEAVAEAPAEELPTEEAPAEVTPVEEAPAVEEVSAPEQAPVEEEPPAPIAIIASDEDTEDAEDAEDAASDDPNAVVDAYEAIDLTDIDFRDADFVHDVDISMIDKFAYLTEAAKVSEKVYVGRTAYQLKIVPMSYAKRRLYRVRKRNLVYNGEAMRPGVRVPYTKEEFAALSRKERKEALADAKTVLEYNRTCAQIALIQVAKTDDLKLVEKLKRLENQLELQRMSLPVLERWKECIKEK